MLALSLIVLISLTARAGAHGSAEQPPLPMPYCQPELESNNRKINAGQLIERLLKAQGEAVGATDIGLIEMHTQSGESIISQTYWSNDGSKPLTSAMMTAFAARLSRRIHQGTRINAWTLNMESGRLVIQSVPLDQLAPRMDERGTNSLEHFILKAGNWAANAAEYDQINWRKRKLGGMFGEEVYEIRDASAMLSERRSYIRYSQHHADDSINQPYITIEMVRGNPEQVGLGQYLIKRVVDEHPGQPIYGVLARENGARFKKAMLETTGLRADGNVLRRALAQVPAIISIPGRALLKTTYDASGELTDVGIVRYPDYSKSTVEIMNWQEVMADPRFRNWMASLHSRPSSYFGANPEFN